MTIVEQIVAVREEVCEYACKYREDICRKYKERATQKIMLQQYCHNCPLTQLHYIDKENQDAEIIYRVNFILFGSFSHNDDNFKAQYKGNERNLF